jgi:hypothetical protein
MAGKDVPKAGPRVNIAGGPPNDEDVITNDDAVVSSSAEVVRSPCG